ncbi:MAG: zinc metalloprotease HtpX [bacterium]
MAIKRRDNEYRESDAVMIPSKNGYIVIPTNTIRQPVSAPEGDRRGQWWHTYQAKNMLQFALMLAGMTGLLAYVGFAIAGMVGLLAISVAGGIGFIVMSNTGIERLLNARYIRAIGEAEGYALYGMVKKLSDTAGLEKVPRLFLDRRPTINAYTIEDRARSAIVLSESLLTSLNQREIRGVLAHEIAHLKNNDIGIMLFSDQVRRLTGYMAIAGQILLVLYLPLMLLNQVTIPLTLMLVLIAAPSVSMLFQIAISRNREFKADLDAVVLSGDAAGLASALNKINVQNSFWQRLYAPYSKMVPELLRSHPNTPDRIERLRTIQKERDLNPSW